MERKEQQARGTERRKGGRETERGETIGRPPCEAEWQAVATNDAAYDGQFVYAVKTTGIFCRPSCK